MNPHREPQHVCEVCTQREEDLKKVYPFQDRERSNTGMLAFMTCPACKSRGGFIKFKILCRGRGQRFLAKKGYWLFGWRKQVVITCDVSTVSHFHMACMNCSFEWLMQSALEDVNWGNMK